MNDKDREAFEKWATSEEIDLDMQWGKATYVDRETVAAMKTWQAALDYVRKEQSEVLKVVKEALATCWTTAGKLEQFYDENKVNEALAAHKAKSINESMQDAKRTVEKWEDWQKKAMGVLANWGDREDNLTPQINASLEERDHAIYLTALEAVGNRHSKYALVDLVYYLMIKAKPALSEDELITIALEPVAAYFPSSCDGVLITKQIIKALHDAGVLNVKGTL